MVNLCQYKKFSCFGCCGHNFEGKEKVLGDIRKNTKELITLGSDPEVFRDRYDPKFIRSSGVCMNLTFLDERGKEGKMTRVGCPLHPAVNKGKDIRDECCDKAHLCKTFYHYKKWPKNKQKAFLVFIDHLNLDNYDYSLMMDNGKLMEEFEKI
jgi:hypothetical protein